MEFHKRTEARKNLLDFTLYTKSDYQVCWFHKLICEKLTLFAKGEIKQLMIFVPPQHGKSELSSRRFPAFVLGLNPDKKIAIASYAASLAKSFNRDVQRIIDSPEYANIFPETRLSESNIVAVPGKPQRNSDIFEIVGKKGSLTTVGVGGGLTGKAVDIGIIDDVYKDFEEANSQTTREMVKNWYDTVFVTRLHNQSQQLILFTRWHEDDLANYILSTAKKGDWEVIELPAIKEDHENPQDPRKIGEALYPEKHSLERLLEFKRKAPLRFQCLYQQRPKKAGGNKIKTGWFGAITHSELVGKLAGRQFRNDCFLDAAYTEKTKNDPSALMSCVYLDGYMYIVDSTPVRKEFPELLSYAKDYVQRPGIKMRADLARLTLHIEPKASGTSLAQTLRKAGFNAIEQPAPTSDKIARVENSLDFIASGRCIIVQGAWNEQFLIECGEFPLGKHDDQVDNLTSAIRHYDRNTIQKAAVAGSA